MTLIQVSCLPLYMAQLSNDCSFIADGFYPPSNETDMMRQMSLNDYPSQQQRYGGNRNYPPMMNRDYQT